MTPLLEVIGLSKRFPLAGGRAVHALDDVSFTLARGESLGIVGESGCGKTTLSRIAARLVDASGGAVVFDGADIAGQPAARFARDPRRGDIQLVFQDATDSFDPRYTASAIIAEPLRLLRGLRGAALAARVAECARLVGLPVELLGRYPHQLSGGQKARVGIARAIATEPKLLVLDEPTSALDVSVQALVLRLLADLRARLGLSYLFVSHDLNVVRMLCDRVLVMYLGRVCEIGPADAVLGAPRHPYTQALAAAIPTGQRRAPALLGGEPMSPVDPPASVCRFASRCGLVHARCHEVQPVLRGGLHAAACHLA
jgi:oligopeptide/dipeptide ABC transporter ATP-binding protein